MENLKDRVTIYEVAKASGVSLATVSRVINNSDTVKEDTKKKVMAVIKKLGYKILYLADTKAIHHMGGSSGKKTEMMRKNGELFLERNFSPLKIKCIKLLQNLLKTR